MKLKLFLLLLIPVFMNASDADKKETNEGKKLHEILYQTANGAETVSSLYLVDSKRKLLCSVTFNSKIFEANEITVLYTYQGYHNKGYGSRLFKQAIAHLYTHNSCSISFFAIPFGDQAKTSQQLENFYKKLGAKKDTLLSIEPDEIRMYYPLPRAAAMAALLPILEPKPIIQPKQLPNESLSIKVTPHDPLLVIMHYIDEEKPEKETIKVTS